MQAKAPKTKPFGKEAFTSSEKTKEFHAPHYVAGLLEEEQGIHGTGHDIGEKFQAGNVAVTLTPADHAWQNESPKHHTRDFQMEDFCGFWLDAPEWKEFNGDPEVVKNLIVNLERVVVLAPGESYCLEKLMKSGN